MTDNELQKAIIRDQIVTLGNEIEHLEPHDNRIGLIEQHLKDLDSQLNELLDKEDEEVIKGYEKFMSPHAKDRIMAGILGRELVDHEKCVKETEEVEKTPEENDWDTIYSTGYNDALADMREQEVVKLAEMTVMAIRNMSQEELDSIRQTQPKDDFINLEL